jgi:glyoxylase-like metal-dependent hydrolase (beta-lactamase superfamily II)
VAGSGKETEDRRSTAAGFIFEHGLKPRYIIDTHTHADHISVVRDLKRKTSAKVVMHEKAPSSAVDVKVEDGDRLYLGELALKFLYTSGHAKDLVCVLLPGRILTADALLIGSCGRTDLPNGNSTQQYHTLYYTLRSLPDELLVYPGHDYHERSHLTFGGEKRTNPKMNFDSERAFVQYMEQENPRKLSPVYGFAEALKANMEYKGEGHAARDPGEGIRAPGVSAGGCSEGRAHPGCGQHAVGAGRS